MKNRRKILSLITSISLICMLIPMKGFAEKNGWIYIGNESGETEIATASQHSVLCGSGSATYDPDTNTLTLDNAEINTTSNSAISISDMPENKLNIILKGKNKITTTSEEYGGGVGINANETNLTISSKDNGTLEINAKGTGFLANGENIDVTLNGVSSLQIGTTTKPLSAVSVGTYSASGMNSVLNIINSSVYIDECTRMGIAVYGDMKVSDGSSVTVKNCNDAAVYVYGTTKIDNSEVDSSSITANALACEKSMEIVNGAEVTATTTGNYASLWSAGNMSIDSSKVTATATGNSIWCDSLLEISGKSNVEVTAGTNSMGIGTGGGLSIADQASVHIKTSYSGLFNDGSGDIKISDQAIVDINSTYGIWNRTGGNVAISGGTVTVNGSGYAIVNKPNLSGYTNPVPIVSAGTTASDAQVVADPANTNYHNTSNYVKIEPGYEIVLPTGTGYTAEAADGSASPVAHGNSYSFTVTIAEGYEKGTGFAVKANGTALTPDVKGVYTISNITGEQTITVEGVVKKEAQQKTYDVSLPTGTGYTAAAANNSESPVTHGGSYSFTITIAEGYEKGADFAVKANGTELTADADGVYTISNITEEQTITVEGVERKSYDVTLPTGAGYTAKAANGSASPVTHGNSYSFTVAIAEGYEKGTDFAVKANGVKLTANADGVYTISNITEEQTVTVEGVKEITRSGETETKIEINENFTDADIPQELKDAGYDTVAEIDSRLKTVITQLNSNIEGTALYDVILMYSEDGGKTWIKADETHFPKSGKLLVALPVPEGTDINTHDYIVSHMFTSSAFGKVPGNTEQPEVTERIGNDGKQYIDFYVTGLSPVMVAWENTVKDGSAGTGDDSDMLPWIIMAATAVMVGAGTALGRRRKTEK